MPSRTMTGRTPCRIADSWLNWIAKFCRSPKTPRRSSWPADAPRSDIGHEDVAWLRRKEISRSLTEPQATRAHTLPNLQAGRIYARDPLHPSPDVKCVKTVPPPVGAPLLLLGGRAPPRRKLTLTSVSRWPGAARNSLA